MGENNMVKVRIAYMSFFGNSKLCAEALRDELSNKNVVDMISIAEGAQGSEGAELVIICSPVRAGNLVKKTRNFMKTLAKESPSKYAFVVTHSMKLDGMWSPVKPVNKHMKFLNESGFIQMSDPLYIEVKANKGPIDPEYRDKIAHYVKNLNLLA